MRLFPGVLHGGYSRPDAHLKDADKAQRERNEDTNGQEKENDKNYTALHVIKARHSFDSRSGHWRRQYSRPSDRVKVLSSPLLERERELTLCPLY